MPALSGFLFGTTVTDVVYPSEGRDNLLIMSYDNDGGLVLPGHLIQDANHRQRTFAVKGRCWFIGKNYRRPVDQRTGYGHALLLTSGEVRRHGSGTMCYVQRFKQFERPLAGLGIGSPGQHWQQRYIVGNVEKRDQIRCLKDETDLVAAQCPQIADLPAFIIDHFFTQGHLSVSRLNYSAKTFKQGAFAGARRTYKPHDFAWSNLHVYTLECINGSFTLSIALAQSPDLNPCCIYISHR